MPVSPRHSEWMVFLSHACSFGFVYFLFLQVHNEFILPSEKEGFIHRIGDIIKRAESMMKDSSGHHEAYGAARPSYLNAVNSLSGSQVSLRVKKVSSPLTFIIIPKDNKLRRLFE